MVKQAPIRSSYHSNEEWEIAMEKWLEQQIAEDIDLLDLEEEWYDSYGNISASGAFDAGGHYYAERDADYADYLNDLERDNL